MLGRPEAERDRKLACTVVSLETSGYRGGWRAGHIKWPAGPQSDSQTTLHPFPDHTLASISSTLGAQDKEKYRAKPSRDASKGKGTFEKASPWHRLFPHILGN